MSTTQIAATLFQLQQLDLELERLLAEQQAIVRSLQGSPTLRRLRAEHAAAQQQLRACEQAQREAELALEDLNHRLAVQGERLYSGSVTSSRELNALQQEIQHLRTAQDRQEDEVLAAIAAEEAQRELLQHSKEALRAAEQTRAQESATSETRRAQLEARKQELQSRRTQLITGMNAAYVQRYESMRRTKQGRAVSRVEQNSCQWCRVILTPSELQHVRTSSELQTCTNCGRILYYDR